MLTPTKIPFRYYGNCKSTHLKKKKFIVVTKVSLPSFYLLIFLWNRLSQTSCASTHTRTHAHTFSQPSNIHSTNMCFTQGHLTCVLWTPCIFVWWLRPTLPWPPGSISCFSRVRFIAWCRRHRRRTFLGECRWVKVFLYTLCILATAWVRLPL